MRDLASTTSPSSTETGLFTQVRQIFKITVRPQAGSLHSSLPHTSLPRRKLISYIRMSPFGMTGSGQCSNTQPSTVSLLSCITFPGMSSAPTGKNRHPRDNTASTKCSKRRHYLCHSVSRWVSHLRVWSWRKRRLQRCSGPPPHCRRVGQCGTQ